jgi:hypothetical protein
MALGIPIKEKSDDVGGITARQLSLQFPERDTDYL